MTLIGDRAGTYQVPESVSLPLNVPVDIAVNINPATPGAHSALIEFAESSSGEVVDRVNLMTISSVPLGDFPNNLLKINDKISIWNMPLIFVDIPEDIAAIGFNLAFAGSAQVFPYIQGPFGGLSSGPEIVEAGLAGNEIRDRTDGYDSIRAAFVQSGSYPQERK